MRDESNESGLGRFLVAVGLAIAVMGLVAAVAGFVCWQWFTPHYAEPMKGLAL